MTEEKEQKQPYLKRLISFYFAPVWYSFLTILYLLFFLYFTVFYSGHVLIAYRFLAYTLKNSVSLLGLSYLFWGVAFIITLVIPFSISLYAIFFLNNLWNDDSYKWEQDRKILVTALVVVGVPLLVIFLDVIIRIVANQDVLREFVIINGLFVKGTLI
ncbi:MAG: hypothetical protein QGH85_01300 [Candidatus Pacebacteria bacterium]|jgi:hypothetical protein|nr:hypothetical protein [Parcubacteria group bacterium]MDP6249329.1 hypothetical protein [Candidatus Paceibacterota bacterium]MDP7159465.1 hypothetical protein [Candidatus Paceibacterota bacterium]MDP7365967.1 hypothetical protein [Candidatus Paceibacterota bacterium]MDP7466240.1 hypothetical protein [Candidatus Paceibacterota bacterium]|tara:strand:+ start:18878 stop:19351 length:474 start_codon:yes stop_codon:yes gene_type:complete